MLTTIALSALSIVSTAEYCGEDGRRIRFIDYGPTAETYVAYTNKTNRVEGPFGWVKMGGEWRRTGVSKTHEFVDLRMRVTDTTLTDIFRAADIGPEETTLVRCGD